MSDGATTEASPAAREEALLAEARAKGTGATLGTWIRLSGPGWLQSAITLGGGSLASALYLGVLTGTHFLWVQVFAMALGVVALGAISWVTLTTGENPFRTLRDKVSPVLAWSWLGAVMMANIVWALPQFSLAAGVVEQNLLPDWKGTPLTLGTCAVVLGLALPVVLAYGRSSKGVRTVELVLRVLVGAVVLAFFGVVVAIAREGGGFSLGSVLGGLVPDLGLLVEPAPTYAADLAAARFPELADSATAQAVIARWNQGGFTPDAHGLRAAYLMEMDQRPAASHAAGAEDGDLDVLGDLAAFTVDGDGGEGVPRPGTEGADPRSADLVGELIGRQPLSGGEDDDVEGLLPTL